MQYNLDSGSRLLEQDGQRYLGEWRTLASGPNYKVLALLHKSLDQAEAAFARATALHPDSWAMWRQAAPKDARGLASGPAFWARVDALGDRPYYPPSDIAPSDNGAAAGD